MLMKRLVVVEKLLSILLLLHNKKNKDTFASLIENIRVVYLGES